MEDRKQQGNQNWNQDKPQQQHMDKDKQGQQHQGQKNPQTDREHDMERKRA
jgi:hypothetical protein